MRRFNLSRANLEEMRELRDFRVTVTSPGHAAYGGAAEHDDLVIAVGLAVWRVAVSR